MAVTDGSGLGSWRGASHGGLAVHKGGLGSMVALQAGAITTVPLADVVGRVKPVDEQLWDTANGFFEAPLRQL